MSGAPLSPRATATLSDFRAREEHLRRLDSQLNDKKNAVVRRAEELVKMQSDRLAQMAAERSQPSAPAPTFVAPGSSAAAAGLAPGQHYHHVYNAGETGFLEETTGYRGKYDVPVVAGRTNAATAGSAARPASGSTAAAAARIQHARPVSAASQDGRRRSSGIPTPGSATAGFASASSSSAAPVRSASAARITPSTLQSSSSSSRPPSRTQPRGSAAPAPAAAASAYSEDDAADDQAAAGDDYSANGDGGGDDGAVGADDGDAASAADPLGYGGDASGAASAAGMGTAATLRFQRARLKALDANVAALTSTLKEREKELSDLKSLVKNGNESREKQLRAKEALERSTTALQSKVDELQSKLTGADSKLANLDRELSAASKRKVELENEAKSRDAKLNRALGELERTKETLAARRNGSGAGSSAASEDLARDLAALKLTNKKLLAQRAELLGGFKKQARLIELLKRQKMHVEMAKMLQFTEEEFAKTLEMGEI